MKKAKIFAGVTLFTALVTAVPVSANAEPPGTVSSASCNVTGTLQWGVKESFRAYISSSIAKGDWQAVDGANYKTPFFEWQNLEGTIARNENGWQPETILRAKGSVHFTGHEGALDVLLANPTLRVDTVNKATLLLDVRATSPDGKLAIDQAQVDFAQIQLPAKATQDSTGIAFKKLAATLSDTGAKAFGGFYAAGEKLDTLTVILNIGENCDTEAFTTGAQNTQAASAETINLPPVKRLDCDCAKTPPGFYVAGGAAAALGLALIGFLLWRGLIRRRAKLLAGQSSDAKAPQQVPRKPHSTG